MRTRTSLTMPERWSRLDPLTFVVGVVALVAYWLHGFDAYLSRDLAIYGYAGQQVADGVPPYVGILNRAGPLAHVIPAIGVVGARLVGIDEVLGMRLVFLALSVACVCIVYLLARDLFASRAAGLAAAAAFLTFGGFILYASGGPREKTAMILFQLCSLWAVKKQRWFLAGFFLSLATLVLQIAFLPGLAGIAVGVLVLRPLAALRALLRIAAGGLLPVAVFVVYFALVGALQDFVDAFLLINARYSLAVGFLSRFDIAWRGMKIGYGYSLWVVLAGLAALALITLSALLPARRREDPPIVPIAAVGASGAVAVVWTLRDFDSWPDAFLVLPMAAIGIGGVAWLLIRWLPARAGHAVTLAWAVTAVALAVNFSVTRQDHRLTDQRRSVAALFEQLPPDATLLSVNSPQALVISGRTNPTRFQTFTSGMGTYVEENYPGGLAGFAAWIRRETPTVITVGGGRVSPWLAGVVESDYERLGSAPGWVWYVHKSAGPVELRRSR